MEPLQITHTQTHPVSIAEWWHVIYTKCLTDSKKKKNRTSQHACTKKTGQWCSNTPFIYDNSIYINGMTCTLFLWKKKLLFVFIFFPTGNRKDCFLWNRNGSTFLFISKKWISMYTVCAFIKQKRDAFVFDLLIFKKYSCTLSCFVNTASIVFTSIFVYTFVVRRTQKHKNILYVCPFWKKEKKTNKLTN